MRVQLIETRWAIYCHHDRSILRADGSTWTRQDLGAKMNGGPLTPASRGNTGCGFDCGERVSRCKK